MDPKIWGKSLWTSLFSIALAYPINPSIDEQSAYKRFFYHLKYVLPCETCRINFENHIRNVPIDFYLYNRKALFDWLLIIHNEVNKTTGKGPITAEEAARKYITPDGKYYEMYLECPNQFGPAENSLINALTAPCPKAKRLPKGTINEAFQSGSTANLPFNWNFGPKDVIIIGLVVFIIYSLYFTGNIKLGK